MQNIKEFLESKETYNKVIKILSEKLGEPLHCGNKPDFLGYEDCDGFIAGGSVANILNSLIYGGNPVIRDIDVFYPMENHGEWVEPTMAEFPNAIETGIYSAADWYGNRWVQPSGDFAIMKSQTRDGIFNHVEMYVGNKTHQSVPFLERCDIILAGFDINSCGVGIDMVNKKFLYTKDFVEFLETRQLKTVIPINPLQTVIRLIRKQKDLNCYCDFNNEFKLLQYGSLTQIQTTFGKETYEKYLKNKKEVDKLFNIIKIDIEDNNSFNMYGNNLIIKEGLWLYEPKLESYELPFSFSHPIELINYWRVSQTTLSMVKKRKYKKIIDSIYSKGVVKDKEETKIRTRDLGDKKVRETKLILPHKLLNHKRLSYVRKLKDIKIHKISSVVWYYLLTNKKYYDCDFDMKHVEYIEKFIAEHGGLSFIFDFNKDLTVQKQYRVLKEIKKLSNKLGQWIIGEIENMKQESRIELGKSENKVEFIEKYLNEISVELKKPLIEPLDLSSFKDKNKVKELTTTIELREEGVKMGHCVGGYSSSIKEGRSRIFHIEHNGIGSTVEISLMAYWNKKVITRDLPKLWVEYGDKNDIKQLTTLDSKIDRTKFRISQHYGRYPEKGNIKPTEENIELANNLTEYLCDVHLEPIIKDLLYERYILEKRIVEDIDSKKDVIGGKDFTSKALHEDLFMEIDDIF